MGIVSNLRPSDCFTLELTVEDIARGIRRDCQSCPIARAFKRVVPGCYANIGSESILGVRGRFILFYPLPSAWKLMSDFDNGRPVEPTILVFRVKCNDP